MNPSQRRRCALFLAVAGTLLAAGADAYAIVGRPLTPISYAGVARRTTRRAVAYGAAAAPYYAPAPVAVPVPVGAVPALPAGCVPNAPCGGAVYRPTYVGPEVMYVP